MSIAVEVSADDPDAGWYLFYAFVTLLSEFKLRTDNLHCTDFLENV